MRIAFVVHEFGHTFGHSRYVWELSMRFRAAHEVHVFANRVHERVDGIAFHHVPAVRRGALATILSFVPAATWGTRRGFDIVHTQGLATLRGNVVTAHICLASWFEARRAESVGDGWRQRLFERIAVPLERSFYRRHRDAAVIAISEATRADLELHYGVQHHVTVIPHGVDLAGFSPDRRAELRREVRAQLALADDGFTALFVGDLRRGAATAIDAVARVPAARLLLVSRSDVAPFAAHAARAGAADRVHFLPPTDRIERMYAAADAFVFPTPYDAFGMVIVEAMAMGLPVITTRRAGAAELIDDEVDGLLVDSPADVEGIAARLARLVGDPALARRVGTAARARAEQHSWDDVAQRTLAVYERARAATGRGT